LTDYRAAAEKLARAVGADTGKAGGHEEYAARLLKAQEDARDILDQAKAQAQRIIEDAEKRSAEPQKAGGQTKAA
jgi:F0F1-type ATP synthase membrane subunit b/b'